MISKPLEKKPPGGQASRRSKPQSFKQPRDVDDNRAYGIEKIRVPLQFRDQNIWLVVSVLAPKLPARHVLGKVEVEENLMLAANCCLPIGGIHVVRHRGVELLDDRDRQVIAIELGENRRLADLVRGVPPT